MHDFAHRHDAEKDHDACHEQNGNSHHDRECQEQIGELLDTGFRYYEEHKGRVSSDLADLAHPRKALEHVLHPLAYLYAFMAEMHCFPDANSRMRNIFLQANLIRAGGHHVLLPDAGWIIYSMETFEEIYQFFLGGWCAYEYYVAHGVDPYVRLSRDKDTPRRGGGSSDEKSSDGVLDPEHHSSRIQLARIEALRIAKALYDKENDVCDLSLTSEADIPNP